MFSIALAPHVMRFAHDCRHFSGSSSATDAARWLLKATWCMWLLLVSACQSLPGNGTQHASTIETNTTRKPSAKQDLQAVSNDFPASHRLATVALGEIASKEEAHWAEGGLWTRLRRGMAVAPLRGTALQRMEQMQLWYAQRPSYLQRVFERSRPYLFDIVAEVEAAGLPMEVALLPAVESAFMPHAVSRAKAAGLWQFMAYTGQRFQLRRNIFVDDRRNPRAAAQAAMRYLSELRQRYDGDMQLALAAYNCGEGCIDASRRKALARGLAGGFEDLNLNSETAFYVPRLMALSALVARAVDERNLLLAGLPLLPDEPLVHTVALDRDIDKALAASMAGISKAELEQLNPQHKVPVIVASAAGGVVLPVQHVGKFKMALSQHEGPTASWSAVRIRTSITTDQLARTHGGDATSIHAANAIPSGHTLVLPGSTVLVPRPSTGTSDIERQTVDQATIKTAAPIRHVRVHVGKGWGWSETARALRQYGASVTTRALRTANQTVRLKPGWILLKLPH